MHALRAIVGALFVPIIAGGLVLYILHSAVAENGGTLSELASICLPSGFSLSLQGECSVLSLQYHFLLAAFATALAGIIVIAAFTFASVVTGSNRIMLSFVFPALSFSGLVLVSVIVTAQIGLLAGALYFAEQFWLDRTHVVVVLLLAAVGVSLGLSILWRSIRMFQPTVSGIIGAPLSAIEQPRLALLVQQIARATGARNPDNIVLGLDTNFFATNAPIRTPTSPRLLTGQTLYLSLPLMRVMSLDEMKAVVGHELAHFSGADATYSRHFAPIYRGLAEASSIAEVDKPYDKNPLLLPARLFLRFMTDCFARNAARASRRRELRADQLGAQASAPTDLAYALIKAGILSMLWRDELEDTVRDIQRGRFRRNMSRSFEDKLKFDVDPNKLLPLVAFSLGEHTPHPTDSHPTTDERITALGLNSAELGAEDRVMERFFPNRPARSALDNMENIEEILTQVYHHLLIDPRHRDTQCERSDNEIFVVFLTSFLAHMVVADGLVDDREIEVAEREALKHVRDFDQREFRDFCRHPQNMTPLEKLAEWSTKFLSPKGFEMLLDLLTKIAEADGEMHERERRIIENVREIYDEMLASEATGREAKASRSVPAGSG